MKQKLRLFTSLLLLAVASVAWAEDKTLTITQSALELTGSYSSNTEKTIDGITFVHTDLMKNNDNIQAKASTGVIYNKTGFAGDIVSVAITHSGTARATTILGSSNGTDWTQVATGSGSITGDFSGKGFKYFKITRGSNAAYWTKIVVTYTNASSGPVDPPVTFAENSIEVEVGKTVTNEISAPSSLSFTYSSKDPDIASVNESGEVTGVAEGSTIITASWAEVTGTWNAGSKRYTVTVIPEKQAVIFEQVRSANQLVAGNEYILVATENSVAMGPQNETKYRSGVEVKIENNQVVITDQAVAVLTLGGTENAWTFLSADNSKYLGLTANDNYLSSVDDATTVNNHAVWSISNDFQLVNNGYPDARYVKYNSSNPRFACYKSGQKTAVLFMKQGGTVETKTAPEFSFGETTAFTVNAGADFTAPTLSYAEGYDGTVTYSSSNEDIAVVDANSGEVVIGDKAGTVTITASAPATDNFLAGEASYTITVVKPLTIAEFVALDDNTKAILKLDAAQVVYKNGDNMYVRDGSDAINLYQTSLTWELGEVVAGTLNATKDSYRNTPQAINVTEQSIESAGAEDVEATSSTVADAKNHLNDLVTFSFNNITTSSSNSSTYYYATSGNDKVQLYNKFGIENMDFSSLEDGKEYKVTGIIIAYNSTIEICPTEAITEVVDERDEAGIAFNPETLTITEGETFTQPTFVNPNSLNVTFESDNEDVAMWDDENNELVLMDGIGTAVITATFDGNESYKPATAMLTVTVKEDLNFVVVVEGCGIYQKITSANDLEAGKRYLIVYENGDKAVIYNGQNGTNSYAGKVDGDISGNKIDNTSVNAASIVLQRAGSNNWYLMDGDNFLYWNSGNTLEWTEKVAESDTWTIDVENGQIINAEETTRRLQYNTGSPRFACYTGTQKDVVLYKELMEAPQPEIITVSVNALATDGNKYYSTLYYSDKNLKIPAGVKASGVSVNGKSLVMGPELAKDDVIAKGNAVLLTADAKGDYEFTVVADTEVDANISWDANLLRGNDEEATTKDGDVYYQLSLNATHDANSIGFYWGAENGGAFTNKAHRAYLAVKTEQAGGAKGFAFNDMATGIKSIAADTENGNAIIYNLAGQRVSNAQKGIYIVNGKKVVIR